MATSTLHIFNKDDHFIWHLSHKSDPNGVLSLPLCIAKGLSGKCNGQNTALPILLTGWVKYICANFCYENQRNFNESLILNKMSKRWKMSGLTFLVVYWSWYIWTLLKGNNYFFIEFLKINFNFWVQKSKTAIFWLH